ncbi:membrane pilin protein UpsF [Metallosphaera javensis (ex Sakai et al. 2022)]|uniref:membrane pilin protein UpsF n=1 Tax=Metallosphaera javensis (ex Sakai et al. 2022) TaxID=2775498 RepID=UPI00259001CE|nr:MAG: integrale membrane protein involved in the assembly of the UV induced pili [Metallosphaera javensis (ex Sakai et al. 2022)]
MSRVRFEFKAISLRINKFLKLAGKFESIPFLSSIYPLNLFSKSIRENMEVYGGSISKLEEISKISFLIFLVSLPAITILILMLGIYFIPLLFISFLIYFLPIIYVITERTEYISRLNLELLSFSILMYLNASLGKGLHETFNDVSQSTFFVGFKREFEIVQRYILFHGVSFLDGIQRRIRNLKSGLIVKLYSVSISSQILGIAMGQRSLDLVNDLLNNVKETFNSYASKASEIVEVMFSLFLLVPLVTIGFQGLSRNNNNEVLLIPLLFAPLIYLWISISQPNMGIHIKIRKYQIIGLVSSLTILAFPVSILFRLGLLVLITQIILIPSYLDIRREEIILSDFPIVLREIGEFTKLGYGIRASIQKISFDGISLHRPTIKLFENIKKQIQMGENIYNNSIKNDQLKFILELLNILDRKGGEGVRVLQELGDMIYSISSTRSRLQRELTTFNALALITPVLFWFSTTSIESISNFSSSTLSLMNLGYSLTLALLYTRISKFTFINPLIYIIVTGLSILLSFVPPGLIL